MVCQLVDSIDGIFTKVSFVIKILATKIDVYIFFTRHIHNNYEFAFLVYIYIYINIVEKYFL